MATRNVPQGEKENGVHQALTNIDGMVQEATETINALAKAAQKMLSMDATSLLTVSKLLEKIGDTALSVQDSVNTEAEKFDANYINAEYRSLSNRLHAQQKGMNRISEEVSNG